MHTFSHLWQYLAEFFLEWYMFQIKVEKVETHFLCNNFLPKTMSFMRISKNVVEPWRPQMTIWRHVAWLFSKATRAQAHSHKQKYVICDTISRRQQWFCELTSILVINISKLWSRKLKNSAPNVYCTNVGNFDELLSVLSLNCLHMEARRFKQLRKVPLVLVNNNSHKHSL